MTESTGARPPGISDELRPYVDNTDVEAIDRIGERLEAERPVPSAAFRMELRARLDERAGVAARVWKPRRLRTLVLAYSSSGLLLLAVATLGLSGAGPLGY
jgi:hypothetical protein